MTHYEYTTKLKPGIPCAASHMTFGGHCLNCGYDPGTKVVPCGMCCGRGHYPIGSVCPQCVGKGWLIVPCAILSTVAK